MLCVAQGQLIILKFHVWGIENIIFGGYFRLRTLLFYPAITLTFVLRIFMSILLILDTFR